MLISASQRILVTGGTGFIGRYVVDLLCADGVSPLVTTNSERNSKAALLSSKPELVSLDLTNFEQVNDLVQNYKPQIVLHLAGVTGNTDPTGKIYDEVNFNGTTNLLKALEKIGVTHIVMIGSAAEYGKQPIPFREDMHAMPVSQYAISKTKANQFALDMHAAIGFPVTILRVFTAYGYGQPHKMFLSQVITHGLLNKHFKMSDGLQKRDFVFIEDVAAAIRSAATAQNAFGHVINIGSGKGMALRDVAQKVWEICGADEELLDIGAFEKSGDDAFDTEADISLAAELLDWHPGPDILSKADDFSRLKTTIRKMKNDISTLADR